jgi:hypothetical protein
VVRKNVVTLPTLQAGTHDASHQGWDGLPHVDVLDVDVGVFAAGQAGTGAAAGYLVLSVAACEQYTSGLQTRACVGQ